MSAPIEISFRLGDREFASAFLGGYLRRRAHRLRLVAGAAALALGARAIDAFPLAAALALALGAWQLLRPLAMLLGALAVRRRTGAAGAPMRVRLDASGLALSDGRGEARFAWADVVAAGAGRGHLWFELARGRGGAIPLDAVGDPAAFAAAFRERGKWTGPLPRA